MAFRLFKLTLTKYEQYIVDQKEKRAALSLVINRLITKPFLVDNFTLQEIYVIQLNIFFNYLLEKLYLCNCKLYFKYRKVLNFLLNYSKYTYLHLKHYVITDISLYKLLWVYLINDDKKKIYFNLLKNKKFLKSNNNFEYNMLINLDKFDKHVQIKSLLNIFELFLSPIFVLEFKNLILPELEKRRKKFKKNTELPATRIYLKKKYPFFKFHDVKFYLTPKRFLTKEEYKKVKYYYDSESLAQRKKTRSHVRIDFRNIPDIIFYEDLLILQDIKENPYQYIHIVHYFIFLKILNLSNIELCNQIKYAKLHNKTLLKINKNKQRFNILKTFNLKKDDFEKYKLMYNDLDLKKIKSIESKKILGEYSLYCEYSLKTVNEFVEKFLFKLENLINIIPILDLYYQGLKDQYIYFDFYNLLVISLKKIKFKFNLYTISFIVDFLEFIYRISYYAGRDEVFFTKSLQFVTKHVTFSKLRLFKFNYWVRFDLFRFNDSKLMFDYFFNIYSYSDMIKFFNYYFDLFNISILNNINVTASDIEYFNCDRLKERLKEVDGLNFLSNILLISECLDSFYNLRIFDIYRGFKYFFMNFRLRNIRYYLKFADKSIKNRIFINNFIIKYKKIKKCQNLLLNKYYYKYNKYEGICVIKINDFLKDFRLYHLKIYRFVKRKNLFFTLPFLRMFNLLKLKENHIIFLFLKVFNNARNRKVLGYNVYQYRIKLRETLRGFNQLRLMFFTYIVEYNKENQENKIDVNIINFWNLFLFNFSNNWIENNKDSLNLFKYMLYNLQYNFKLQNFKKESVMFKLTPKIIINDPHFTEDDYVAYEKTIGGSRK